ncbi:Lrp/AsnC family transcriptional regulator [Microbacterium sp. RD1]|uniref:Lrp/AsnC family transcriptional regulator n=1 Tax=Microbacterium sp. RD1 TaxID=3457313 RepID=UPI003FA5AB1C
MIDRLDAEIISKLAENARIGIAELAAELGVSRTTIQLRLRRLEDEGVLLGFQPIVNLSKVGAAVEALITLEIDQRRMATVVRGLHALPEVLEVRIQAGREDILAHVGIASLEDLQVLTTAIVGIEGVRKTTSMFTVSTPVRYRLAPLLRKLTAEAGWGRASPAPGEADPQARP